MTRRTRHRRAQAHRFAFACGMVALAFGLLALASTIPAYFNASSQGVATAISIADTGEGAPEGSGEMLEELSAASEREHPASFDDEFFDLSGRSNVRIDATGSVISFLCDESGQQAFAHIAELLSAKGWVLVDSGNPLAGSFVKDAGTYRWAFVSCVPIAGQTSVVMQTVPKQ